MLCPRCNLFYPDDYRFCTQCGHPLQQTAPTKKGSHWVPILILLILSLLGTTVFYATRATPVSTGTENSNSVWFEVYDGYLYFDESRYTGSSEIVIPSQVNGQTVYAIGEGCFENCTWLTTAILPDTLLEVGSFAFAGCTSLRGIYLPEQLLYLDPYAFANCAALEAIVIPSTTAQAGAGIFSGCDDLRHVFYDGTVDDWRTLFPDPIGEQTEVHCKNGIFSHGLPQS